MIRVLRLLEYVYESAEEAEESMSHWGVPANGTIKFNFRSRIKSAIITDLNFTEGDSEINKEFT